MKSPVHALLVKVSSHARPKLETKRRMKDDETLLLLIQVFRGIVVLELKAKETKMRF